MDYEIMPGLTRENAQKAIALAEKRGFAAEDVKTSNKGFLIPVGAEAPADKPARRKRATKEE